MQNIDNKHYTVYQTTNLINKHIYIGVHTTKNLNDDYLGSGKILKNAIRKHGKENFKKETLYDFYTLELAYWMEKILVNKEFINREDTYNIVQGGPGNSWQHMVGAPSHRKGKKHSEESRLKMSKSLKGRTVWNTGKIGIYSEETLKKLRSYKPNKEQLMKLKLSHMGIKPSEENIKKRKSTYRIKELSNNWLFYWYMIYC